MANMVCPDCQKSLRSFIGHDCGPKSSSGGVEGYAGLDRQIPEADAKPRREGSVRTKESSATKAPQGKSRSDKNVAVANVTFSAGIKPGPLDTKRGRPRIGEVRPKPWIDLGMSQRTWFRRQAEKRAK